MSPAEIKYEQNVTSWKSCFRVANRTQVIFGAHRLSRSNTSTQQVIQILKCSLTYSVNCAGTPPLEFSHNTQSWQCWHLIQMHKTIFKEWKGIQLLPKIPKKYTVGFGRKKEFFCMYTLGFGEKINSLSLFEYHLIHLN